jgi:hypothetical protein
MRRAGPRFFPLALAARSVINMAACARVGHRRAQMPCAV